MAAGQSDANLSPVCMLSAGGGAPRVCTATAFRDRTLCLRVRQWLFGLATTLRPRAREVSQNGKNVQLFLTGRRSASLFCTEVAEDWSGGLPSKSPHDVWCVKSEFTAQARVQLALLSAPV